MPLTFSCSCGKTLRVGDEHAGKRVKCPSCGEVIAAPAVRPAAAPAAASKPKGGAATAAAPPAPPVRFGCDCGKQLQAKAELAGKRIKCPGCGAELVVPRGAAAPKPAAKKPAASEALTASPKARRPEPVPTLEPDDEDEAPRPKKRKPAKGVPLLLILGVCAAALLVLASGVAAGWYFFLRDTGGPKPPSGPPVVVGTQPRQPAEAAPDLDLVPRDAAGFASLRVARLWQSPGLAPLKLLVTQFAGPMLGDAEKQTGLTLADVDRATLVMLGTDQDAAVFIVSTTKPIDRAKVVAWMAPNAQEKQHQGKTYHESKTGGSVYFVNDRLVVAAAPGIMPKFLDRPGQAGAAGPLSDALKLAAGDHHLVIGANPPADAVDEARKSMPPELKPFEALLDLKHGALAASLGSDLRLEVQATYPDEARAAKAKAAFGDALAFARVGLIAQKQELAKDPANKEMLKALDPLEKALQNVPVEQNGATVRASARVEGDIGTLVAALGPLFAPQAQGAGPKAANANNLKELALAMLNYHDARGHFPPGVPAGKDGRPLYSWRVELLPFLGQEELYNEFKKDEPWNSPHNMKLIPRMPKVFAPVHGNTPQPGMTFYQVVTSPPGGPRGAPFSGPKGPRLADFTDGSVNTFLIVEGARPVIWTRPEDVVYFPGGPPPQLGGQFPDGFHAATADASVRFIERKTDPNVLRALITHAGGEVPPKLP